MDGDRRGGTEESGCSGRAEKGDREGGGRGRGVRNHYFMSNRVFCGCGGPEARGCHISHNNVRLRGSSGEMASCWNAQRGEGSQAGFSVRGGRVWCRMRVWRQGVGGPATILNAYSNIPHLELDVTVHDALQGTAREEMSDRGVKGEGQGKVRARQGSRMNKPRRGINLTACPARNTRHHSFLPSLLLPTPHRYLAVAPRIGSGQG